MPESNEARHPEKTFSSGRVRASIWSNQKQDGERTYVQKSIRIQKRYKDKGGNFQSTDYYFPDELAHLRAVIDKAFEYACLKESDNNNGAA